MSIIEKKSPPLHCNKARLSTSDRLSLAHIFAEPEMQKCMLQLFISDILNVIDALGNVLQLEYKPIAIPHVIFEWSMTHFKRRMAPDFSYIESVLRKEDLENLSISKLLTDLQNLKHHVRLIANGQVEAAYESLVGCRDLLNIREELDRQLVENTQVANGLAKMNFDSEAFTLRANQAQVDLLHETMDRCIYESVVSLPIFFRYERNYFRGQFDDVEHKLLRREEALEHTKKQYLDTTTTNNYVLSSVMDHHNGRIEFFKNEIKYWSAKYEQEYDKLVDQGTLYQLRLKALEMNWKDSFERIEFFHTEIRSLRENVLLEQKMRADRLAAEAKERVEAELLRKQEEKKRNKKGKSKT